MSTLDGSTREFTLKDSNSVLVAGSTQKTHGSTEDGTAQGTGGFGMKPIAPKVAGE